MVSIRDVCHSVLDHNLASGLALNADVELGDVVGFDSIRPPGGSDANHRTAELTATVVADHPAPCRYLDPVATVLVARAVGNRARVSEDPVAPIIRGGAVARRTSKVKLKSAPGVGSLPGLCTRRPPPVSQNGGRLLSVIIGLCGQHGLHRLTRPLVGPKRLLAGLVAPLQLL